MWVGYSHFSAKKEKKKKKKKKKKKNSVYAIFKDQSFNDTLTNDIVSFEQLGPAVFIALKGISF